jgi:hypothetical protein
MRRGLRVCGVCVAGIVWTSLALGQYEMPREYSQMEARYFSGGAMTRDFAPRAGYTGGDSLAIIYNTWMPMVGYHQGPVDVLFGYTSYTLHGASRAAIFFGTTLTNDMPIINRRPASLVAPIFISLDYTKSESAASERDVFNIASIGLGVGLKFRWITPGTEFSLHAAGIYHYSFEGFSTGNGSSTAVIGEASMILRTIHIADGVVVGYRFRHQTWSLGDGRLNYRVTSHGPYIGVLL